MKVPPFYLATFQGEANTQAGLIFTFFSVSVFKPAFGHATLHKLQEKTPVGSVVFDKEFWPTTDALDEMRRQDEWLNIQEIRFL